MTDDDRSPPAGTPGDDRPASHEPASAGATAPPSRRYRGIVTVGLPVAVAVAFGVLLGLGAFTFGYGKGYSYMLDDPQACANCHVMDGHLETWLNSSHRRVATCNDCHLPHDPIGKWVVKADNGFFHSMAFTLENFHEPIQIKPRNRRVTQDTCLYCHRDFVHSLLPATEGGDMLTCIHCHDDVGHGAR